MLPLIANFLLTVLIAGRIWWLTRGSAEYAVPPRGARSPGFRATMIVVESGVLYLVVQLVFVVLTALNHPAQETVAMMAVQIYVSQQSALNISIRMHFY